ncbi:MAG: SAM-dependent methyltransferase [Pseudomonadota bacterium]
MNHQPEDERPLQETPLMREVRARIFARGPISVAEYMALVLGDPQHGYYTTRDPLGVAGDFTTAPEISQMFGELVGLWLAQAAVTQALDQAAPLIELGPGRGTLMADALRVAPALDTRPLWLVETSVTLRAVQSVRLPRARWIDRLDALPDTPMLLVANEFIDVLPLRQYLADERGWREIQVGLNESGDALSFGLSGVLPLPEGEAPPAPGDWREESPAAEQAIGEIARRVATCGGAALLMDYGYVAADRPAGPTLQAVRGHTRTDALQAPGEADLTWLPDFDTLAATARTAAPVEAWVTTQGAFLTELGIGQRAAALATARPGDATALADGLERLVMAEEMGQRHKVLAILPKGQPRPPGFDPATPVPRRGTGA